MKPLPLPVRVAAGLAAAAVEQARKLPRSLAGLPVTVASTAMQLSMRAQQHVTELAIKGDEILATLRPAEETPEWATFDEDLDAPPAPPAVAERLPGRKKAGEVTVEESDAPAANGAARPSGRKKAGEVTATGEVERLPGRPKAGEVSAAAEPSDVDGPAGVPGYDDLSLAQVRARLRWLSVDQLEELLAYELTGRGREEFVRMLTRRIATVRES
ncbi:MULTISPECIES: lipid droplet-associated protein [unclassified Crossiella]|uniref:lipid droplet-associated protein n=1 Tax=unclassified Crossiella TaxID=2620835 RepID=UPI001FFF6C9B|nr:MULTISPECIES: lipid droplet-associated protein [unclassified Crossiella]MCK2237139.1 lipid droplet-associated protein [Crossiella sp. S99.2]MCK2250807.1 lipid droplet-associated protein [Crossiella sp. S99.1]